MIVDVAKKSIIPSNSTLVSIKAAVESAREAFEKTGGRRQVRAPRILPLPSKIGGVSPLIPIFSGLSPLGALAGGAAGIAKAVKVASAAKK